MDGVRNIKIEGLRINISYTFVSKNEFEGFVLPWIRLTEGLYFDLHNDTNFIGDSCEWLRGSNFKLFKWLWIKYRGKVFGSIEETRKYDLNIFNYAHCYKKYLLLLSLFILSLLLFI